MRVSTRVVFEISMEEILRHVDYTGDKKEFLKTCRNEMKQTLSGFTEGQGNYRWDGMEEAFFQNLVHYHTWIRLKPDSIYNP